MSITIKDVALEANVSVATVSRVINNKGYISSKTRYNVQSAMKKLNYKPNIAARTLQGKSTATIGLIMPSLENPMYAELFEHIENALYIRNFQTILCTSNNQLKKEGEYLRLLEANRVEGIISGSHSKILEDYKGSQLPIISFDRKISKDIPTVRGDNFEGGRLIAQEVAKRVNEGILILSGSEEDFYPINDRIKGIMYTLDSAGISYETAALPFESSTSVKKELVKKILKNKEFNAIICTDDLTALMTKLLTNSSKNPPLITGYDGSKFIRTYHPELMTIEQPIQNIAELLVKLLIKKILLPSEKLAPEYVIPVSLAKNTL